MVSEEILMKNIGRVRMGSFMYLSRGRGMYLGWSLSSKLSLKFVRNLDWLKEGAQLS